jgi:hypothetical protein
MPAFKEDALVWAPAIADLMIGADRPLDVALGKALGELASGWNSTALRGQVLRVVRARLPQLKNSRGVVSALAGLGLAGLKTLLEIANDADESCDDDRVSEVLTPIWRIIDSQTDAVAAACLEILFRLLPAAGPATRRFLIHYFADCIDSRHEAALHRQGDWQDFRCMIPMMVRFFDDHATHHPALIAELSEEIQRLHTYHSKSLRDSQDWSIAAGSSRTESGRAAVRELLGGLYPAGSPFAIEELGSKPSARPSVSGEVAAQVIDGLARCPACGAPLPTRGSEAVVSCERCTRPVRIPAGVRTELEGRSFADEIEHWSEAELVKALRAESDVTRRTQIAAEINSARTHGGRYIELIGEIVDQMIEDDDDHVVIDLENALERMAKTGGNAYRAAFIEAVRRRPASRSQSRLLASLGLCGEGAFELLIQMGLASFAESHMNHGAAANGAHACSALLQILESSDYSQALINRLLAVVLEMPETHDEAGKWQLGEGAASVVAQVFCADEDSPTREALKRSRREAVLDFLDAHIDSDGTTYSGMAPRPGAALFYEVGGAPGLERLVGFIESLWGSPLNSQDLGFRLGCLKRARHDEVKLVVLCSIKDRPDGLSSADVALAEPQLKSLEVVDHLATAATAALAVLRGAHADRPQHCEPGERTRNRVWRGWSALKGRLSSWLTRLRS